MQYLFKQAVKIQDSRFSRGIHEVREDLAKDSFFLKLRKFGLAIETSGFDVNASQEQSIEKRVKEMLENGKQPAAFKSDKK